MSRIALLLGVVSIVLVGVALWLAVDNPTIDDTSRGDYTCLAPWDTVLNDAANYPGGEPPPDDDEIAARCRQAGEDRFDLAIAAGVAAGVAALSAMGLGLLSRGRDRRPDPVRS